MAKERRPLQERFDEFHAENPRVYELFRRFACEAREKVTTFAADAIVQQIRWHTRIVTQGDDFKINNNWGSYYARLLVQDDPTFADFFEFRTVEADRQANEAHMAGRLF